jgi:hypothetical protein
LIKFNADHHRLVAEGSQQLVSRVVTVRFAGHQS